MKQRFYGKEKEIMMKAHGLYVSGDTREWDFCSGRGWSYNAIPTYCSDGIAPFTLVHKETVDEDGMIQIEEYLYNDFFNKEV